jgi:hypothetical protein
MKSITIHGLDDPLAALIKAKAKSEGLSINQTVKTILESALGVKPMQAGRNRRDFEEFFGAWTENDLAEFDANTKELHKIDPEDWR